MPTLSVDVTVVLLVVSCVEEVMSVLDVSAVVVSLSVDAQPHRATHRTASAMSELFRSDFILSSKFSCV